MEGGEYSRGAYDGDGTAPRGGRRCSGLQSMGKQNQTPIMQVSSEWKLEKTQEMRQVRQFLKEEGDVDREAYGDGIQYLHKSVRKDDISGEIL